MARKAQGKSKAPQASGSTSSWVVPLALAAVLGGFFHWWRSQDAALRKLKSEVSNAGGYLECVEPMSFGGIRGLGATCDFDPGTKVVTVPKDKVLDASTMDRRIQLLIDEDIAEDPKKSGHTELFALVLAYLSETFQGPKSSFATYLTSMPTDPPETIALWDDEQKNALSSILPDIVIWNNVALTTIRRYVQAEPSLFGRPKAPVQRRAFSYILSRNTQNQFIPIVDLVNHNIHPNSAQQCGKTQCWLESLRSIKRGEEITISYGVKSDLNLLFTYGFAIGSNVSALSFPLEGAAATPCGPYVTLDHEAPLAVAPDVAHCVKDAVGQKAFLELVEFGCSEIARKTLNPRKGVGLSALGLSRANPEDSLKELHARTPAKPMDSAIEKAIRRELATMQRCDKEAKAALAAFGTS